MQQCMGFRMLRVSDPRISDALVLWGRWSPTRATPMRLFCGGGFPHALLHGVSHAAGLRPAHLRRACFVGAVVSDPRHSDALVCGGFVIFAGNNEFVI